MLNLLPGIFSGKHVDHPKVEFHRARVVRVEGPKGTRAHIDGEIVGQTPVEFRVIPEALRVIGVRSPASSSPE